MSRPGQRFVPVRSIDNQAELMRHRARELLAGQRTAALNALRGHLAEIGLVAPQGAQHAYGLKRMAVDGFNENGEIVVPDCVRGALRSLVGQIDALDEAIGAIDRELAASVKADETAKRLMTARRSRRLVHRPTRLTVATPTDSGSVAAFPRRIRQPSRSRGGLAHNRAAHDVFDVAATDADIAQLTVRELRQFAHRLSITAPSVQLL